MVYDYDKDCVGLDLLVVFFFFLDMKVLEFWLMLFFYFLFDIGFFRNVNRIKDDRISLELEF